MIFYKNFLFFPCYSWSSPAFVMYHVGPQPQLPKSSKSETKLGSHAWTSFDTFFFVSVWLAVAPTDCRKWIVQIFGHYFFRISFSSQLFCLTPIFAIHLLTGAFLEVRSWQHFFRPPKFNIHDNKTFENHSWPAIFEPTRIKSPKNNLYSLTLILKQYQVN